MAKTYNTLSTVSAGSVLTATAYNEAVENSNNYRVPPMCKLQLNATIAAANATDEVVAFQTASVDTDDMATTGAGAKITAKTAGIYLVSASLIYAPNATGNRAMTIARNGVGSAATQSGVASAVNYASVSAVLSVVFTTTVVLSLAVNDYLQLVGFQNSGGTLNIGAGSTSATFLSAVWVGQVS